MVVLLTDGFAGTVKLHLIAFERVRESERERERERARERERMRPKNKS
jgi:hypothetical protein